jgi:hypothetical protein
MQRTSSFTYPFFLTNSSAATSSSDSSYTEFTLFAYYFGGTGYDFGFSLSGSCDEFFFTLAAF